jgi:hypothetical protein
MLGSAKLDPSIHFFIASIRRDVAESEDRLFGDCYSGSFFLSAQKALSPQFWGL